MNLKIDYPVLYSCADSIFL
jgi:hypothetical protein